MTGSRKKNEPKEIRHTAVSREVRVREKRAERGGPLLETATSSWRHGNWGVSLLIQVGSSVLGEFKVCINNIPLPELRKITVDGVDLLNNKCKTHYFRQQIKNKILTPKNNSKIEIWAMRTKYLKYTIPPKYKEIPFEH